MTDMSKYKNVSLQKETYSVLEALSKVLLPDGKLSISETIDDNLIDDSDTNSVH
jgi:hypothetical protein